MGTSNSTWPKMNSPCLPNNFTIFRLPFLSDYHYYSPSSQVKSLKIIFESFSLSPHVQPIATFSLIHLLSHRPNSGTIISYLDLPSYQIWHLEIQSLHRNPRPATREMDKNIPLLWENFRIPFLLANIKSYSHHEFHNRLETMRVLLSWVYVTLIKIRVWLFFFLKNSVLKLLDRTKQGKHSWQGTKA